MQANDDTSVTPPLSDWAERELTQLASATGSHAIASLNAQTLLGERAALSGFRIPGEVSAGGGCRFFRAQDGWIALNLSRPDDRDLLPALFEDQSLFGATDVNIRAACRRSDPLELVARGREMGLALAALNEPVTGPSVVRTAYGPQRQTVRRPPRVIDLSALWAGPLATNLLWLAGAEVIKVENQTRPDGMRDGDPAFFDRINQGKASVLVDLKRYEDRAALQRLIEGADIVIEAARPRALAQLGIDADALVQANPGLVWLTITGHGGGDASGWVGFGDDCGVAAGLSKALYDLTGAIGFVGDATADPLTGLRSASLAWRSYAAGRAVRMIVSMKNITAEALEQSRANAPGGLEDSLRRWSTARGRPFPQVTPRTATAARLLGADTKYYLNELSRC